MLKHTNYQEPSLINTETGEKKKFYLLTLYFKVLLFFRKLPIKQDNSLKIGAFFIAVSVILYLVELKFFTDSDSGFLFFFSHYGLAAFFWLIDIDLYDRKGIKPFGKGSLSRHILLLILFNISAFSLNRMIPIYYESADWLSVFIVCENVLLFIIAFSESVSNTFRKTIIAVAPLFLLFHLHQAFVALPMTIFGLIGSFALGVGLLLFIPLFYMLAWYEVLKSLNYSSKDARLIIPATTGFCILLLVFAYAWTNMDNTIKENYLKADQPFENTDLPTWVSVSSDIDDNWLTEAYLKSDLVYQTYDFDRFILDENYDEKKVHDPIITFCMGLSKTHPLTVKDRIKILEFMYNKRHYTVNRFWRDDNLITDRIVNNVELFPAERLSYTEMILSITNTNEKYYWREQEEAIYTFQLPKGGVVTSLSLWINGVEEKAILTSKSKAQTAYNTIVGREQRDPSVIYWMEGNKARIRVFPCTPREQRKFKLGVTAPLKLDGDYLNYQSIYFEGPDFTEAISAVNVVKNGAELISDFNFKNQAGFVSWEGNYEKNWQLKMRALQFEERYFTYKDEIYEARQEATKTFKFNPKTVYLDITSNWTDNELETLKQILVGCKVNVLKGSTELEDSDEYPNFTLFPYNKVYEPKNSIVITKGGMPTPNMEDIKASGFRKELFSYFKEADDRILVLDLGETSSDFNRSLQELGAISLHQVNLKSIEQYFKESKFPDPRMQKDVVNIYGNGMSIHKVASSSVAKGSDHLMRLFYYQNIMDDLGKTYFDDDKNYEEELAEKAAIANVVTPVSSLIVLETQKDYDRFEIKKNKDSLGNAAIKGSGAVPEPHEWALIIIGAILIVVLYFKKKLIPTR